MPSEGRFEKFCWEVGGGGGRLVIFFTEDNMKYVSEDMCIVLITFPYYGIKT